MLHNDHTRGSKNLLPNSFADFLSDELMQSAEKILNHVKPSLKPYKISDVFNNVGITGPLKVEVYLVDEDKMPVIDIPISEELKEYMAKAYEKEKEKYRDISFDEHYDPYSPSDRIEERVYPINGDDFDEETKRKIIFKERFEWWIHYSNHSKYSGGSGNTGSKSRLYSSKALGCYWPHNKEIWICYDMIKAKGLPTKQEESLTANVFIHELAHALMDINGLGYSNEYELWLEESLANKIMLEYLTAYDTHQNIVGHPSRIDMTYVKGFVLRQDGPYRIGLGLFENDSADWALYKEYKDCIVERRASQWRDYVCIYHYTDWHPVTERKLYYPIFPKRAIYQIEVGGVPAANMKDAVIRVAQLYISGGKTISDLEPDLGIKTLSCAQKYSTELKDSTGKTLGYIYLQNLVHGDGGYFDKIVKKVNAIGNPALKITCMIQKRP